MKIFTSIALVMLFVALTQLISTQFSFNYFVSSVTSAWIVLFLVWLFYLVDFLIGKLKGDKNEN